MIYVFLADGFEEIEAITAIDVLRRAGLTVKTVAVGTAGKMVAGAHGVAVEADLLESQANCGTADAIVLPGGMPGTLNLERSPVVQSAIDSCMAQGKLVAAICAAPSILGHKGCLQGKQAVCYPGFEEALAGAAVVPDRLVVKDGTVITGKGPGAAIDFALALVETLCGGAAAKKVGMDMQWHQG